ncbi:uncharacterized protein JCM15063_000167 [Sporobolomyces koalae]|uniref:uncharacterized protein n=1 Tax=Sporobolomyces koalae TaxID=500713 RepID=UPI003175716F
MGLFSHKKDVIVGPSGYAYNAEEDDGSSAPRRSSVDHNRSSRTSHESPRKSIDSNSARNSGAGAGVGAGAAAVATAAAARSSTEGSRSVPTANNEHERRAVPEQFTAGTVPPTTTASAVPVAPMNSTPVVQPTSSLDRGSGSLRQKVVETAKAPHAHPGREKDSVLSEEDAKNAAHDHKYLQPVIHEKIHHHHVEEIEYHRTVDRHVHHVQHHIQPIVDERHAEEVHLFREVPVTHIKENHAMSEEDRALFDRLNVGGGTTTIIPHEKVVINKGETMRTENIIHHVHHIVQPIYQRDLHEYFRLNPPNPAHAAPYSTSYTGPGALGTAYYPNPASIAVQHGQAQSVGGSIPQGVKEGHKLVPIEGSRHEIHYVNREPVQSVETGRTEVFPTRHNETAHLPSTSKAPYQAVDTVETTVHTAPPTAAAGQTAQAEQGMRNLSLGLAK